MKNASKVLIGLFLGVFLIVGVAAVYEQLDLNEWSINGVKITATAAEINAVAHDRSVSTFTVTTLTAGNTTNFPTAWSNANGVLAPSNVFVRAGGNLAVGAGGTVTVPAGSVAAASIAAGNLANAMTVSNAATVVYAANITVTTGITVPAYSLANNAMTHTIKATGATAIVALDFAPALTNTVNVWMTTTATNGQVYVFPAWQIND